MLPLDDLIEYIFNGLDGEKSDLSLEFAEWVRQSRRFKEFAHNYRSKIRSKLKNVRDEDGVKEVRAELEVAALLSREESFALEYEKYAATRKRGPDFTVTFKTHTLFNMEVRRIRGVDLDGVDSEARIGKLRAVLCDKVGQMPPGIINLLWLTAERALSEVDLTQSVTTLRQLAERKAEDYFTKRGFVSAADFLKQYSHLSGIVLRHACEHGEQVENNILWLNSLARHKVPPPLVKIIQRL